MNKTFDEFLNKLEIDTAKLPVEAVTVMHVGFNYLQTRKNKDYTVTDAKTGAVNLEVFS